MIKILFVDDEPALLAGIRRMLYSVRDEWDMHFANGGTEALEMLAGGNFDVVVSDMRMPGMDGATLLQTIRQRQPDTIRIILSGQSDAEAVIRSVPVAHQFLSKPCDQDTLRRVVQRSIELHQRLRDPGLRGLLGEIDVLPSTPKVIQILNEALGQPDASIDRIADVVETDPALTAKLLQLVNSSFFGLTGRVGDVRQAVAYLGLATVRNMLAAVELVRSLPATQVPEQYVEDLLDHGLAVAQSARTKVSNERLDGADAFSAGMLQDVGLLAIASALPKLFIEFHDAVTSQPDAQLADIERTILPAAHTDLGAYLLSLWGLPSEIVEAVARHHETSTAPSGHIRVVAAVQLASAELEPKLWRRSN